jgi:hypothetical protein
MRCCARSLDYYCYLGNSQSAAQPHRGILHDVITQPGTPPTKKSLTSDNCDVFGTIYKVQWWKSHNCYAMRTFPNLLTMLYRKHLKLKVTIHLLDGHSAVKRRLLCDLWTETFLTKINAKCHMSWNPKQDMLCGFVNAQLRIFWSQLKRNTEMIHWSGQNKLQTGSQYSWNITPSH